MNKWSRLMGKLKKSSLFKKFYPYKVTTSKEVLLKYPKFKAFYLTEFNNNIEFYTTKKGILPFINDEEVEINMDSTNDTSEDTIITNCEVAIGNGIINYEQEIAFQESITDITKVDRSNCAVLNDYTTEQLQVLIASLAQRIQEIINVKFNGGF